MEKKFYVFACVSMILLITGISIFTRFVDGYYQLKNCIYFIATVYCVVILVITLYLGLKK